MMMKMMDWTLLCVVKVFVCCFSILFFVFFGGKNFKNFPFSALEGRKGEEEKAFSSSSEYHSLTHSLTTRDKVLLLLPTQRTTLTFRERERKRRKKDG